MGTDRRVRANGCARTNRGRRVNVGGRMNGGAVGNDAEDEFAFRRELFAGVGGRLHECHSAPTPAQRDFQPEAVARYDLPSEFRAVDAAQIHARLRRRLAVAHENGGDLRKRLDHEHRRQQRRAWEMPLEELFVNRDVLDGDKSTARLVLEDGVDEHRGISVAQAIQRLGNVDRHSCQSSRTPEPARPPETTATARFERLTRRAVARLAKRP